MGNSCFCGCLRPGGGARGRSKLPDAQALLASAPPLALAPGEPMRPAEGAAVAAVVLPGTEDPKQAMCSGSVEIRWQKGEGGAEVGVRRFRERPARRIVDERLALPTLYLHFLHQQFLPPKNDIDHNLRAGNDNEEVRIDLPAHYTSPEWAASQRLPGDLSRQLAMVMRFLASQGEVPVSAAQSRSGAWGPRGSCRLSCSPTRHSFSLRAARPKAGISLDKAAFGIPAEADLYLFAQNHRSVAFMDEPHRQAFEACIGELPSLGQDFPLLASFLKVFYEGGFAYNKKIPLGGGSYLPENVGVACMSVVQAFEGQCGIATGYPYLVEPRFLPFVDTTPVTIRAIADMSPRHQRYGLCFTRCVLVWEGDEFETDMALDFCCITPHGGFYYVPGNLGDYWRMGGLIYAFGEDTEPASAQGAGPVAVAGASAPGGEL